MKYFAALRFKDIITLIFFVAISFVWILVDQIFLKETNQRFLAFLLVVTVLFFLQFLINKPVNVWNYANTVALILIIVSVGLSLIVHVIVNHDFNKVYRHSIIIWVITALMPYFAGSLYLVSKKKGLIP